MWCRQAGIHFFWMLYSADGHKKWVTLRFPLYDSYRSCFLIVWFTPTKTLYNEKLSTLWNCKVDSFFCVFFFLFYCLFTCWDEPALSIWRLLIDFSTVRYRSTQISVLNSLHILVLILRDHLAPSLQAPLESPWCLASASLLLTMLLWSFLGP